MTSKKIVRTEDGLVMDQECSPLCGAINRIPGLKTVESCCGHGSVPFAIYFYAASVHSLYLLTRICRLTMGARWAVEVLDTDRLIHDETPVLFRLSSRQDAGKEAYDAAAAITKEIDKHISKGLTTQEKVFAEEQRLERRRRTK